MIEKKKDNKTDKADQKGTQILEIINKNFKMDYD